MGQQQLAHRADLPGAGHRSRVVDGQHQVGGGRGGQARGDHVPGFEPVGQRDHRVVMSQRRADPAGDGLGGGHRRNHPDPHPGHCSASSKTAVAIANTPGSPEDTTATARP